MAARPRRQNLSSGGDSSPYSDPSVLRMALGAQLRRLREARGITAERAGAALRASHAKISRLELGRVGFKERDVVDLLELYGVTDEAECREYLELARRANEPGWWHSFGDITPRWFEIYLGLEQSASIIRVYESQFVPGLLQTPEYARAVTQLGHLPEAEAERRVDLRMRRQKVLDRVPAPMLWAVIEESALRRPLAAEGVMRNQLLHLVEMARRPHITLQLVPSGFGGHAATGVPFSILRFQGPDLPDIVYLEQLTTALYLDKRQDVDHYAAAMDSLCAVVMHPSTTVTMLADMAAEL
jgi:transcriptional regulator with XRE-family HTH domain